MRCVNRPGRAAVLHALVLACTMLALWFTPAAAQRSQPALLLTPYGWGQINPHKFGVGVRVEGRLLHGHLGVWGDLIQEHLSVGCYTTMGGCSSGRTHLFSAGLTFYPLSSRIAPYLGAGIGRRYYIGTRHNWRYVPPLRYNVPTLLGGVDLQNRSGLVHIRLEAIKRGEDPPEIAIGFGVGIL